MFALIAGNGYNKGIGLYPNHSYRKASIGSKFAAFHAG